MAEVFRRALGGRALVREQKPLVLGDVSVPEPDVAVLPGSFRDYLSQHPTSALLVVEVADSSLPKDRLSKSRIYAGAAIPEYWILNVRGDCLEVSREPDAASRTYMRRFILCRGERLCLAAFPDVEITVDSLLPWPPPQSEE